MEVAERVPLLLLSAAYALAAYRYANEPAYKWIGPIVLAAAALAPSSWLSPDSASGLVLVPLLMIGLVGGLGAHAWWIYRTPDSEKGIRFLAGPQP